MPPHQNKYSVPFFQVRRCRLLRRAAIVFVLSCAGVACSVFVHDEDVAAAAAIAFGKVAFLERDGNKAFALLDDQTRQGLTAGKLREYIDQLHPDGTPDSIVAEAYGVVSQDRINIYLIGSKGNQRYYYRVEMRKVSDNEYHVWGFFRGQGEYPQTVRRQDFAEKYKAARNK